MPAMPGLAEQVAGAIRRFLSGGLRWRWLLLVGLGPSMVWAQSGDPADLPELYLLIRSRRYQQALSLAENLAKTGQYQSALEALQWVFDQPHDVLIRRETGEFRSAWGLAEELLHAMPAEAREQYQRIQGATVSAIKVRTGAALPLAVSLDLVRTSFATEPGYLAAASLVSRWLDEGSYDLAAALALRVIDEPAHHRRLTTGFLSRAEVACLAAGRTADAERIRGTYRTAERRPAVYPGQAPMPVGTASLSFQATTEAVPLPKPSWQQPLDSFRQSPQWQEALEEAWREWSGDRRDRDWPTAVAWQPLVIGRQLVYRDLQTIRAVDLYTGDTLWKYTTHLGVEKLLTPPGLERSSSRRLQWDYWESLFGCSLVGALTTDGIRIYAVDQAETLLLASRRQNELRDWEETAATNVLIALRLQTDMESERLAWTTAQSEPSLTGHAFLGPPATAGGLAYALAENDRELILMALEATSGTLVWKQPVALADRALLEDRARLLRASIPTLARGLVLCPTNVGLLVALDAVTGQFRWYHSCLEVPADARRLNRSPPTPSHRPHAAFVPMVHVQGEKLVYLPSQSDHVYCLDLSTGRPIWKTSQPEAVYVAGVTDEQVVVVGRRTCQALNLATGTVEWTTPLEAVPVGTGVLLRDGFLQPLDSGKVLALDLASGRKLGFDFAAERGPMGHLAATSDLVIAVGGNGLAAYPTAASVARRLMPAVHAPHADPARALELAAVHLAQGHLLPAVDALQAVIRHAREASRREQAERMLCEVYFQLLRDRPEQAEEWYARLEPLCRTPHDQVRRLISLSGWHLQAGRATQALEAARTLAQLSEDSLHEAPHLPGLQVSLPSWLAILERQAGKTSSQSLSPAEVLPNYAELVFRQQSPSYEATDLLARQARYSGSFHAAEIRWLRNLAQADQVIAARAAWELAKLYDDAGLFPRAADQLELLATRFAQVEVQAGQTGLQIAHSWPASSLSRQVWLRRQPLAQPVDFVRMALQPRSHLSLGDLVIKNNRLPWDDPAEGLYGEFQRRLAPLQADAPYEWLIKSGGGVASLAVYDKASLSLLRTISIPVNALWPGKDIPAALGASQTYGVAGGIRCVSLLQGATEGLAWSAGLPGWTGRSSIPLCGPANPFGAVFQLRHELLVVDPADGRLLWHRNDLEPNSGLMADSSVGVLVDEQMVFVLGHDRQSYRIFDLTTGVPLRGGRLDHDLRFTRLAVENLIVHLTDLGAQRRLRIWNAATNELLLDDPLRDRNLWCQVPYARDLIWITPEGKLRVFAVGARRRVVDCALSSTELEGVTSIRAFAQGGRYVVNLTRNLPVARTDNTHDIVREPLLPMINVRDELIAVAPGCQAPLWRIVIPQRSIVQWGQTPAPVLVGVSVVKARHDQQRKWMVVEALDPATGVRLGYSDQLPEMRLYHAEYDATQRVIRLVGERGDIVLTLGSSLAPQ